MYSTERNAPWPHSCHWDAWLILLTEVSVKQDKYWQCTPKAGQILTVHPFMGDFQSKSPGVLELRVLLYWSSASGGPAEHLTLITSYSLSLFLFVCTSLWRSEENVGGFLNFSLPSFLRYCRSLNPELTNLAGWLIEHCAPPPMLGSRELATVPTFYLRAGDLNLALHVCTASFLGTEPSSHTPDSHFEFPGSTQEDLYASHSYPHRSRLAFFSMSNTFHEWRQPWILVLWSVLLIKIFKMVLLFVFVMSFSFLLNSILDTARVPFLDLHIFFCQGYVSFAVYSKSWGEQDSRRQSWWADLALKH